MKLFKKKKKNNLEVSSFLFVICKQNTFLTQSRRHLILVYCCDLMRNFDWRLYGIVPLLTFITTIRRQFLDLNDSQFWYCVV